jgi:lipopolysaccharide export system protein LptA
MRYYSTALALTLAFSLTVPTWRKGMAQSNSKQSSIDSLASNSLLGDSFNDKDFGKLPTNITSDSLTLHAKSRVFVYKGNVVVTQGDMRLTSNEIEGSYSDQNQIQKIVAKGDVVITKQDIQATSQRAIYDAVTSIVTLTDNPQLQQGESVLIADRIKVLLNENRSLAEGNVRVTFVKKDVPAPAAATSTTPPPSGAKPATATAAPTAAPTKAATTQTKASSSTSTPSTKAAAQSKKAQTRKKPAGKPTRR